MKHSEFRIGTRFTDGPFDWQCTDIGTRVIVAIQVGMYEVEMMTPEGPRSVGMLLEPEAREAGRFEGPPYLVEEEVFDERKIPNLMIIP